MLGSKSISMHRMIGGYSGMTLYQQEQIRNLLSAYIDRYTDTRRDYLIDRVRLRYISLVVGELLFIDKKIYFLFKFLLIK